MAEEYNQYQYIAEEYNRYQYMAEEYNRYQYWYGLRIKTDTAIPIWAEEYKRYQYTGYSANKPIYGQ